MIVTTRKKKKKHGCPVQWVLAISVLAIAIVWVAALISSIATLQREEDHSTDSELDNLQEKYYASKDELAIPGIELLIPSSTPNEDPIQVVYTDEQVFYSPPKGIVLLLHACSHSALKFFSPHPSTCPNCVGLSEELRIVRLVLEQGYFPVAVSSMNRKKACWSGVRDVHRIQDVLKHDLLQKYRVDGMSIFAIGASSGGATAANLAIRGVVQGALVMVMQLRDDMVNKLRASPVPIYLAPMPRDKMRMQRVMKNYDDLETVQEYIFLDTTNCASLPVTTEYLVQRVPGMTTSAGNQLISQLKNAGHIDSSSNMLRVDPGHSDWRSIVSPSNTTHFLNKFDLKPGYSPLAKALNRAWAFHEYCSEAVVPALAFLEEQTRK